MHSALRAVVLLSSLIIIPSSSESTAAGTMFVNSHQHHHRDRRAIQSEDENIIYSKRVPGRHVCRNHKNVTEPYRTTQAYCKPVYKRYIEKCNNNRLCSGVKLVYETAYRDVLVSKNASQEIYVCCPGWTQNNKRSHGCNTPKCKMQCQNGGKCIKPDTCQCSKGFSGRYCELDKDECKEEKPCDQICYNTIGSFTCQCRENFTLLPDGQSCRKEGEGVTAFEATDLEFHEIDKRLVKLEEIIGEVHKNKVAKSDIYRDMGKLSKDVTSLQAKMKYTEALKDDVVQLKQKLYQVEKKASKIDDLMAKYDKMRKCAFLNKICI